MNDLRFWWGEAGTELRTLWDEGSWVEKAFQFALVSMFYAIVLVAVAVRAFCKWFFGK